jgi:hypothetical protein
VRRKTKQRNLRISEKVARRKAENVPPQEEINHQLMSFVSGFNTVTGVASTLGTV